MSWELVSRTDSGYRKYRDQWDNLRYLDPDGNFTNAQAWAGTQSHGATETEVHKSGVFTGEDRIGKEIKTADELEGYDSVETRTIDEPLESYRAYHGRFPVSNRGYLLTDYPVQDRRERLGKWNEDNPDYDAYAWGVYSIKMTEDSTITSSGYRFTEHQTNIRILKEAFKTLIEDIEQAVNSSPGEKIIITETVWKGMNY